MVDLILNWKGPFENKFRFFIPKEILNNLEGKKADIYFPIKAISDFGGRTFLDGITIDRYGVVNTNFYFGEMDLKRGILKNTLKLNLYSEKMELLDSEEQPFEIIVDDFWRILHNYPFITLNIYKDLYGWGYPELEKYIPQYSDGFFEFLVVESPDEREITIKGKKVRVKQGKNIVSVFLRPEDYYKTDDFNGVNVLARFYEVMYLRHFLGYLYEGYPVEVWKWHTLLDIWYRIWEIGVSIDIFHYSGVRLPDKFYTGYSFWIYNPNIKYLFHMVSILQKELDKAPTDVLFNNNANIVILSDLKEPIFFYGGNQNKIIISRVYDDSNISFFIDEERFNITLYPDFSELEFTTNIPERITSSYSIGNTRLFDLDREILLRILQNIKNGKYGRIPEYIDKAIENLPLMFDFIYETLPETKEIAMLQEDILNVLTLDGKLYKMDFKNRTVEELFDFSNFVGKDTYLVYNPHHKVLVVLGRNKIAVVDPKNFDILESFDHNIDYDTFFETHLGNALVSPIQQYMNKIYFIGKSVIGYLNLNNMLYFESHPIDIRTDERITFYTSTFSQDYALWIPYCVLFIDSLKYDASQNRYLLRTFYCPII